jgi:hypothetical protein
MSLYDYKNVDPDVQMFIPNRQKDISDSITQNWTQQALECYCVSGDCSRCSIIQENYSFVCQMPKIVKMLLSTNGKPTAKDFLSY